MTDLAAVSRQAVDARLELADPVSGTEEIPDRSEVGVGLLVYLHPSCTGLLSGAGKTQELSQDEPGTVRKIAATERPGFCY